jgi:hypothetical protein
MCAHSYSIAHEIAGAARIRHSLLPCFGETRDQWPGRFAPQECERTSVTRWSGSALQLLFARWAFTLSLIGFRRLFHFREAQLCNAKGNAAFVLAPLYPTTVEQRPDNGSVRKFTNGHPIPAPQTLQELTKVLVHHCRKRSKPNYGRQHQADSNSQPNDSCPE